MVQILPSNTFCEAKWVVSANAFDGTHTTIAAALTSASSGDTIAIRPGTYTENPTLKAGVNLTAFPCDAFTPNVIILGTCTASFVGTCSLSGIQLQTNSSFCLTVSGSSATIVYLKGCYLNATNNTAVSYSSSSAISVINFYDCDANLGTTGIAFFSNSGTGQVNIFGGVWGNGANSSTASTVSAGALSIRCQYFNNLITTSSTGLLDIFGTETHGAITHNSTAPSSGINNSSIDGGSSSALTIGAGATMGLYNSIVTSSNTNAITGAGILDYSNIVFSGTSSLINTTTQTASYNQLGKWRASGQPAFYAYLSATQSAVVGNSSTPYVVPWNTLAFDQNSNFTTGASALFTAPVAGVYFFTSTIRLANLTAAMTNGDIRISVSGITLIGSEVNVGNGQTISGGANYGLTGSWLVKMAAGDTAQISILVAGGASAAGSVVGAQTGGSYFQGFLVA